MSEKRLTPKEKELIAVGAAISAGCIRCAHYHFKKVFEEGANLEEVIKAIIFATEVIDSTHETMQQTAYSLLDVESENIFFPEKNGLDRMSALIKIGAAVAGNCTATIKKYMKLAKYSKIPSAEITVTVKLAKAILKKAGEFADEAILEELSIAKVT